ncbi:MAG: hypothetical protein HYZ53_03175 [Planctomycetes bacterium]|nr:hypothetical protein [Planctomycetota bacterium]
MRRFIISLLLTGSLAAIASADGAVTGLNRELWQHPNGDTILVPCTHPLHPQGHPLPNVPCIHGLRQRHANGDGTQVPCTHLRWVAAGWNSHYEQIHPNGDTLTTPCIHLVAVHPNGDPLPNAPCLHQSHPGGDPFLIDCTHYLSPLSVNEDLGLEFYTTDPTIRQGAIASATTFRALGVEVGSPRRLKILNRPALTTGGSDDPFWSHYNPLLHALQILQGHGLDTLHHELGHALLGSACVQIGTTGGPHRLDQESAPGVAMSEGWANFVAVMLENGIGTAAPLYKGFNWETGRAGTTAPATQNCELVVGATLWDLFDSVQDTDGHDRVSLAFRELFRVFSPSLQLLTNGPIVFDLNDYLSRLSNNNPGLSVRIERLRLHNLE